MSATDGWMQGQLDHCLTAAFHRKYTPAEEPGRPLYSPDHQLSYDRGVLKKVLLTAVLLLVGCVRAFEPGSRRQDLSGGAIPDSAATDSASADGAGGGLDASTDLPPPRSYTQVVTVAGSGTAGSTDGPALQATLNGPHGIALGPGGAILITDNHSVRRIAGGQVTTLAGSGQPGFQDGAAAQARFDRPEGIAVDSAGRIHVGDFNNNRLRLIDGTTVSTVAGDGTYGTLDGPALQAQIGSTTDLLFEPPGRVYVAHLDSDRIRTLEAGQLSTLAGGARGFADGPTGSALFFNPHGITLDAGGAIVVADRGNHRLRRILGGTVSTVAGSGTSGGQDGPALQAQLDNPRAIAVGQAGELFFADGASNQGFRLRRLYNGQVTTLGDGSTVGCQDGSLSQATFDSIEDMVVAQDGTIYLTDQTCNRVRAIQ